MSNISNQTIKKLFAVSNNLCAFPKCSQVMVDIKAGIVIGELCHIKAKNSDGPRFDTKQTDQDRNSFDNLILLCPNHHSIIDSDIESYTVARLLKMKKEHEENAVNQFECPEYAIEQIARTNLYTNTVSHSENVIQTINPVGGQYAHTIQNFKELIDYEKVYTYADILANLYSNDKRLSEILANTLNLANKMNDKDLSRLCINELSGWSGEDPDKIPYRIKEVYISLYTIKNAYNFTTNEELWNELSRRSDEFILKEFLFNEGVPCFEQSIENNKSVNHNSSYIHFEEKQGNFYPEMSNPELIIHIYAKGDTYIKIINGIKNNLAKELIKRIK